MASGTAAGRGQGAWTAGRTLILYCLFLGSVPDARPPEFSHCHNHGMMPGVLAGVQAGWTFAHVRPRLFGAFGMQSAKDRDFGGLFGEGLSVERRFYLPLEFGAKVDWLGAFYTGLDARYAGYPMWSFELGYRLGGLSRLMQPFGPPPGS